MRCLTLADALQAAGAQCHFICREHPGNLLSQIRQRGFSVSALPATTEAVIANERGVETPSIYADWLGVDWDIDAVQTKIGVGRTAVDWLIVDHYALDARWEQTLRPMCRNLMVIDDLADRPHDCDLLLDQNLGRDVRDYRQLVPKDCTVLVGPYYALLRPEFSALRSYSCARRQSPQFKQLLITMGGVDKDNATGVVLEILKGCPLPGDCRISIVMGPHAPWLKQVGIIAANMPWKTEVLVEVKDMAKLMADSDLAIGAAGSTLWERCCLGLPAIVLVLAENQIENSRAMQAEGLAFVIPSITSSLAELTEIFKAGLRDIQAIYLDISLKSAAKCDGSGAQKLTDLMEAST